jgi:hypothetical protein
VPAPREHFLSLAYHALYHKGAASGLRLNQKTARRHSRADHDYSAILERIARRQGIAVPITLADLDAHLDAEGWRPPHDMLVRLGRKNKWVRSLVQYAGAGGTKLDDVAVFLLRDEGMKRGGVERAERLLEKHGFEIVATRVFEAAAVKAIARTIRGGNWGRGPWPLSGGLPVAAIVVRDAAPIAVTRKQRKRFPFVANARLFCKEQIRDAFNEGFAKEQRCNVIHSSDNGRETLDYLRIIMPDAVEEVLAAGPAVKKRAA